MVYVSGSQPWVISLPEGRLHSITSGGDSLPINDIGPFLYGLPLSYILIYLVVLLTPQI